MIARHRPTRLHRLLIGATAALALPVLAASGNIPPSAEKSSIYRRDVPATGMSPEEARNARAAERRGELHKQGEDYTANALQRCRPLSGEYQAACEARVMGFGSTSGSVTGGGVLRQVETVVVPPGADSIRIQPKTENPVLLVPAPAN